MGNTVGGPSPMSRAPYTRATTRRIARWAVLAAGAALAGLAWPVLFPDPLAAARAAYRKQAWGEVEIEARRRLRDRPDDREAWRLLARAQGRQGRHDQAQAVYRNRLGLDAMTVEDLIIAASGLARMGRDDQARIALEKAREREPDHPETLHE